MIAIKAEIHAQWTPWTNFCLMNFSIFRCRNAGDVYWHMQVETTIGISSDILISKTSIRLLLSSLVKVISSNHELIVQSTVKKKAQRLENWFFLQTWETRLIYVFIIDVNVCLVHSTDDLDFSNQHLQFMRTWNWNFMIIVSHFTIRNRQNIN